MKVPATIAMVKHLKACGLTSVPEHSWFHAGSMLVAPAGMFKSAEEDPGMDATYVYARGRWKAPVLVLPSTKVRHP